MRGEPFPGLHHLSPQEGSAPHARGNRYQITYRSRVYRSIPACAGEPNGRGYVAASCGSIPACAGNLQDPDGSRHNRKVYPRMRGGTLVVDRYMLGPVYPRMRGGTTPFFNSFAPLAAVYPRMRGGTITCIWTLFDTQKGLSPHARGNPGAYHLWSHEQGLSRMRGEPDAPGRAVGCY